MALFRRRQSSQRQHVSPPIHRAELLEATYSSEGKPRFCTYPFRLYGLSSDLLIPCTWLHRIPGESVIPVSAAETSDLYKAWRSKEFDNVRQEIARGSYRYCMLETCPEFRGSQDYFLTLDELGSDYPAVADYVTGKTRIYEAGPQLINIQYDTACNLSCPSCNRLSLPRHSPETLEAFGAAVSQLGSDLRFIYLAGMGDPFGSPHYYEWLRSLDLVHFPKLEQIILNTNALRWTDEKWRAIPDSIRSYIQVVVVSVDGISKETIETNRWPAKYEDQMDRLRYVASLRRAKEIGQLKIYFVYQENNFREMPGMVRLCRELGVDAVFFARLTNWGCWTPERLAAADVGNPAHPSHTEFLRFSDEVENLGDGQLSVVMMR